jgi:hypothetical protein
MQAGAGIRIATRLLAFLIIGGLLGVSVFAQTGKGRGKPPAVPMNVATTAVGQPGIVERVDALGPEPKAISPVKLNAAPAAKTPVSGGIKNSTVSTAMTAAPVPDEALDRKSVV